MSWNWKFLALLFLSVSIDFYCGHWMGKSHDGRLRKTLLWISILSNLTILGFFKYYNFFADNLIDLLAHVGILNNPFNHALQIILPLGISFYTFEAISYIVDVYKRKIEPARSYWDYALFIMFFPHLVAGPIMRAKDFIPQIISKRILSWSQFYEGAHLFFWGLFEKVFVADNLAKIVDPIFSSPGPWKGGDVLLALYAFSFQIFCDFDGYTNMARGLAKCMGFELTINFKWPYFATNPREFWQRWHISLSSWLKDYVYIPFGGNKFGELRTYVNLALTMLIGGLWHGASWTFVLWGLYHGLLLIVHRIVGGAQKVGLNARAPSSWSKMCKMFLLFHAVAFGWLLFRCHSLDQIIQMTKALFFNFAGIDADIGMKLVFFTALFLMIHIGQYKDKDLMFLYRLPDVKKVFIYALMVYLLCSYGMMTPQGFIYFQF